MGPDEFATREELGLIVKFLFAKVQQQAEMISTLAGMAATSGGIRNDQLGALIAQMEQSRNTSQAKHAKAKLDEFLTIRQIAQRYLDPLEE